MDDFGHQSSRATPMKTEYVILALAILLAVSNVAGAMFTIRRLRSSNPDSQLVGFKPPSLEWGFSIGSYRTVIIRAVEVGISLSAIIVMSEFLFRAYK